MTDPAEGSNEEDGKKSEIGRKMFLSSMTAIGLTLILVSSAIFLVYLGHPQEGKHIYSGKGPFEFQKIFEIPLRNPEDVYVDVNLRFEDGLAELFILNQYDYWALMLGHPTLHKYHHIIGAEEVSEEFLIGETMVYEALGDYTQVNWKYYDEYQNDDQTPDIREINMNFYLVINMAEGGSYHGTVDVRPVAIRFYGVYVPLFFLSVGIIILISNATRFFLQSRMKEPVRPTDDGTASQ